MILLLLAALGPLRSALFAQGTAFTYQGRFSENGGPFSGVADMRFTVWDALSGGNSLATNSPAELPVTVSNGLFTATLEFGGGVFDGTDRWLQIEVRTTLGEFVTLAPRQKLTATPYAIIASHLAGAIASANLAGTYSNAVTLAHPANRFTGHGAGLTDLDAAQLTTGQVPARALNNVWKISGNTGTSAGTHFLGTMDNQPLELWVHGLRALRLEDNGDGEDIDTDPDAAPNMIGGSPFNRVGPGVVGATIAGGGATNLNNVSRANLVLADYGLIGGGAGNSIETNSRASTISGGTANRVGANAAYSAIAGGDQNDVDVGSTHGAIGGGRNNGIGLNSSFSVVAGGLGNDVGSTSEYGTVAGGANNDIGNNCSAGTIGGGERNDVGEDSGYSVVAGGFENMVLANAPAAAIAGGYQNNIGAGATRSAIGGGYQNNIDGGSSYGTIGGGYQNSVGDNAAYVTIAGGHGNDVGDNAAYSTISGGTDNDATAGSLYSSIGGGHDNRASGFYATIPGGRGNAAVGYAFAAGNRARASHTGSFVWADSSNFDFASTVNNVFLARCVGGVRFTTGINSSGGTTAGVRCAQGESAWESVSDRNAKQGFQPVNPLAVLEKVAAMPITRWTYKANPANEHIGPVAQDFHAAFGLGSDDKHISTIDVDGVALAAIQGLNQKLEQKETEIAELKQTVNELKEFVQILSRKLSGGAE